MGRVSVALLTLGLLSRSEYLFQHAESDQYWSTCNAYTNKQHVITTEIPVMWRNSTHDGIYPQSTVAFPYRPRGHYTGVLPQASFNWRPTRHISFSLEGEYVFLGRNVLRSGAAQGAYVQTNLELTF